jgi:hypothetical protein
MVAKAPTLSEIRQGDYTRSERGSGGSRLSVVDSAGDGMQTLSRPTSLVRSNTRSQAAASAIEGIPENPERIDVSILILLSFLTRNIA